MTAAAAAPARAAARAVDLAWDVVARWGADPEFEGCLPRAFFDDFVAVAEVRGGR
jgi:uncharacterized ferritin-like protein (DUF455 family)